METSHSIAGAACVDVLRCDGFELVERSASNFTLARGGRTIVVPDRPALAPALVAAILAEAEMSWTRFQALLAEEPTAVEVFIDADIAAILGPSASTVSSLPSVDRQRPTDAPPPRT